MRPSHLFGYADLLQGIGGGKIMLYTRFQAITRMHRLLRDLFELQLQEEFWLRVRLVLSGANDESGSLHVPVKKVSSF